MSFDTPNERRFRETALARLLAEALKTRPQSGEGAKSSACPDPEILAAYADHGLAEEETAHWESHFADCDRCQKIIAVLAASGQALAQGEAESLGDLAAASVARHPVVRNTRRSWMEIWRRPLFWGWLVPVAGLASAALWIALRQAPRPETSGGGNTTLTAGEPQNQTAAAASSRKPDETQIAQAYLPPSAPAAAPPAPLRDKEARQRNYSPNARQEPARKQDAPRSAPQALGASEADRALQALETREDTAKDKKTPSTDQRLNDELVTAGAAGSAGAPSSPASAQAGVRSASPSVDEGLSASSGNEVKALAKAPSYSVSFGSPDRRALWRLGSGGLIEHSTDQGRTWQPQASGVTADLLAGAAPSERAAWAVGRGGIILRTEDGEHWQRVALPSTVQTGASPVAAPDWIGVEARDALQVTITSRDGRRFVTEDGGRNWGQR
jgi:hypothetical protein